MNVLGENQRVEVFPPKVSQGNVEFDSIGRRNWLSSSKCLIAAEIINDGTHTLGL